MCNGNCNQGRNCDCRAEDEDTNQGVLLGAAIGACFWGAVLLWMWL